MQCLRSLPDAEAANPLESSLRAIALTGPGLHMEPPVVISSPRCGPDPTW